MASISARLDWAVLNNYVSMKKIAMETMVKNSKYQGMKVNFILFSIRICRNILEYFMGSLNTCLFYVPIPF